MRSISTDYLEHPGAGPRLDGETPIRFTGEVRAGYRPRPSTLERSREIREAAARYMAERGVWRFSMLALARQLNCLLPTLCYYYKKREELIADIVLRHAETLRARAALAMDETDDDSPAGELHAFAREFLLVALAEQDFHRLLAVYPDLAGPADKNDFLIRWNALRDMAELRLAEHAPTLAGKPETKQALGQALLDSLSGAALWLEPYGVVKPVAFAAKVADQFLRWAAEA